MGLIKTAILTGGGIYAVNKLVKSQEARHSNQQNNNQNSRGVQQEGYWGPPGLPPNNDRSGPQYQQQWYPANPQQIDQQRGTSPQNNQMYQQPRGSYSEEEFEEVKRPYTDGTYQQRDGAYNPPPSYANAQYAQPQYPQQQYLPPPQWQGYNDGMNKGQSSTMDKLAPLAGVAMGMVASNGSGSGSGRKGRRGGGGLISGLLSDRK